MVSCLWRVALKPFFAGMEPREGNCLRNTPWDRAPRGSFITEAAHGVCWVKVDKICHPTLHGWGWTMRGVPVTALRSLSYAQGLENDGKTTNQPDKTLQPNNF